MREVFPHIVLNSSYRSAYPPGHGRERTGLRDGYARASCAAA